MWSKTYSKKVAGLTIAQVWQVWTDVNQWHVWQDDIDYAKLTGEFKEGNIILFKPKDGPVIKLHLVEVKINKIFVDCVQFPLARMHDFHEIIDHGDELELKTTISIDGVFSFLWRKLVGENIVSGLEKQTGKLIAQVRQTIRHAPS